MTDDYNIPDLRAALMRSHNRHGDLLPEVVARLRAMPAGTRLEVGLIFVAEGAPFHEWVAENGDADATWLSSELLAVLCFKFDVMAAAGLLPDIFNPRTRTNHTN